MEIQDILALVQAVADNGLTELKVDDGNVKLSLKKEHPVVNVVAGNTGAGCRLLAVSAQQALL